MPLLPLRPARHRRKWAMPGVRVIRVTSHTCVRAHVNPPSEILDGSDRLECNLGPRHLRRCRSEAIPRQCELALTAPRHSCDRGTLVTVAIVQGPRKVWIVTDTGIVHADPTASRILCEIPWAAITRIERSWVTGAVCIHHGTGKKKQRERTTQAIFRPHETARQFTDYANVMAYRMRASESA